jgi:hypothetical protein
LEGKDQNKTQNQDLDSQSIIDLRDRHYQREQEHAVEGVMPEIGRKRFVVRGRVVKHEYLPVLRHGIDSRISFFEELNDFFTAKGEDFRSRRFCGIPD